jgi:hypothetical protein
VVARREKLVAMREKLVARKGEAGSWEGNSNGNYIETKAERSFDLDFVFDIEAKEPAYSRTCKD